MQLDSFTAGIALMLVQLCVATLMTGIFSAAPRENCTRYWAASGLATGFGLVLVVPAAGSAHILLLFAGNALLVLGVILLWQGMQEFYRLPRSVAGWAIGALFLLLFGWLIARGAPTVERALWFAVTVWLLFLLYLRTIIAGQRGRWSFAGWLALGATGLLFLAYSARLAAMVFKHAALVPGSDSPLAVALIYLAPIAGSILLSSALLLLYFERIVADKHHLATHDELTGALNRRAIVAGGQREVAVAHRMRVPVALAYVDVDHFKQINDQLGHEAGDRVLVEVARLLKQTCRAIDLVGRYGGDEFCVVFPGADCAKGALIGERLVQTVRQHDFGLGRPVTLTIGVAGLNADEADHSWAALMRRADAQLYKAKAAGRDRLSSC